MEREDLVFSSGETICSAWLYRPSDAAGDVPCVVMAHGFSLTRHDGLAAYAEALAAAGAAVLVIDHRYLGDSGGLPRQRFRIALQAEDVRNAVDTARRLEGIDADRIVLWGFSFSGGTAVNVAAADPRIAGLVLLCPFLDGLARVRATLAASPGTVAWILPRALRDIAGSHNVIPVTGPPGSHAAMTFTGEDDGFHTAVPAGSPWRNEISPGVFASVATHRPILRARRLRCPSWVALGERDVSVDGRVVERFAARAPDAELHRYDVDHFEPFHDAAAQTRIAADQADWLTRTIMRAPAAV